MNGEVTGLLVSRGCYQVAGYVQCSSGVDRNRRPDTAFDVFSNDLSDETGYASASLQIIPG